MNRISAMTASAMLLPAATAYPECSPEAQQYYSLAQKAKAEFDSEAECTYLGRVAEACPTFESWEQFGKSASEFPMVDPNDDKSKGRVDVCSKNKAADAYARAYALASTPKQMARVTGQHAELYLAINDPSRARREAYHARELDPQDPWIADLVARSDAAIRRADADAIRTSLKEALFAPIESAASPPNTTQAAPTAIAPNARGGFVDIQINFLTNTTDIDPAQDDQIQRLVDVLGETQFATKHFVLVGHADARGEENYNLALSLARANAVHDRIGNLRPGLADRIATRGVGERDPLNKGTTEADYWSNRRLEVIVQD